jgi:hypothetical protein
VDAKTIQVTTLRKAGEEKLVELYCKGCGLLIAASPSRKILAIMEKLHSCPVYFRYIQPKRQQKI